MSVNKWTVMKKLSALIILALAVAVGFFIAAYNISGRIVNERNPRRPVDGRMVMELHRYIRTNHVRSDDKEALKKWCADNSDVIMEIFVDGQLVFSSIVDVGSENDVIRETNQEKKVSFPFKFEDAKADIVFYDYMSDFDKALAAELVVSVLLFFLTIFLGIRHEVNYLRLLNEEIQVLEGGDLSKEITIRGNDEISQLAESVDEFRKSMKNQLSTIEQLERSNRLMAAEIAHDLRTPLTSLIMYLDFAGAELSGDDTPAVEYVAKAREKSVRLKTLLEENFNYMTIPDYFLAEKQTVQAYEVLSGYIGDMLTLLESEGFNVHSDVSFGQCRIITQREAIGRVFSNLLSNIVKYADRDEGVFILCRDKGKHMELRIENRIRVFDGGKPDSTGFGSRIVRRLMKEMDGEYGVEETDGAYITILRFLKA